MAGSSPSQQPVQIHDADAVFEGSTSTNHETLTASSPPSPKPVQIRDIHADFEGSPSLNHETLNQPDPENTHPPQPTLHPDCNSPDEDGDDDEGDQEGATHHVEPPIAVSARDVSLSPLSRGPNTRRGTTAGKRKKIKRSKKQQQVIDEKLKSLKSNLNPIPFIPNKILDFAKHENLMKRLGLWDFVNIDFDRNIKTGLLAQLIATYEKTTRASYVEDWRLYVSRADLARAFKLQLPPKKKGSNVGAMEKDLECEALPEDSIGFITEFVNDWVLLHEDTWIMPKEVADWLQLIREGHPEKVDWASLFWFMVEKEVKKGGELEDCYYASHLQHLMKFQREELFVTVESDDAKGDEIINLGEEGNCLMEGGPSTELTLGKDEEKEGILKDDEKGGILTKDLEMMDVEKCKGVDHNDGVELEEEEPMEEEEEEQGQWLLEGKNRLGEHFMQPCNAEKADESGGFDLKNEAEEEEEEEGGDQFHDFTRGENEGFTGNFLGAMDIEQLGFNPHEPLCNQSPHIDSVQPFFNNPGKRVVEHDHSNEGNKKLRINNNESWQNNDNNSPLDFDMCMGQMQHAAERARFLYEEKELALQQSNANQQILLGELHKRDSVIDHLHKARMEEVHKKDGEIYRLEQELYLMGDVVEGYRKALKETRRAFSEYREKAMVPEEPTYKDTGEGGLMLTSNGIEKLRRIREEEFRVKCLSVEQEVKEFEDDLLRQFGEFEVKLGRLDEKLMGLEDDAKGVVELGKRRKAKQSEEGKVAEVVEDTQSEEEKEKVTGAVEDTQQTTEEKMVEDEDKGSVLDNPPAEEKVTEVEEKMIGD